MRHASRRYSVPRAGFLVGAHLRGRRYGQRPRVPFLRVEPHSPDLAERHFTFANWKLSTHGGNASLGTPQKRMLTTRGRFTQRSNDQTIQN